MEHNSKLFRVSNATQASIWQAGAPPQWMSDLSNGGKVENPNDHRKNWSIRRLFFSYMDDLASSRSSTLYAILVFGAIFVSTITFLISNTVQYWDLDTPWLSYIEAIVVAIFTYDYVARMVWVSGGCCGDTKKGGKSTCWFPLLGRFCAVPKENYYMGRFWFALTPFCIIDFLAIVPFYVELIIAAASADGGIGALLVLRLLRLFRIFRLLKLAKFGPSVAAAIQATIDSILTLGSSLLLFFGLVIFFSAAVFYAEQTQEVFDPLADAWFYNDQFGGGESPFQSVYHSMWWGIITITTIGYGDTFPITPAGKVAASAYLFCAVLVLAFPLTLFASAFLNSLGNVLTASTHNTIVNVVNQIAEADRSRPIGKGSMYPKNKGSPVLWADVIPHYNTVRRDMVIIHSQLGDMLNSSNEILIRTHLMRLRLTSWARLLDVSQIEEEEIYLPFIPKLEDLDPNPTPVKEKKQKKKSSSSSSSSTSSSFYCAVISGVS